MNYDDVLAALNGPATHNFWHGAPDKKQTMVTDVEQAIVERAIYLRYFTATVPCSETYWNSLRREIEHANAVSFTTAAFLTPRRKAYCKEIAIFATVSNLAHILCWPEENMNLQYGKHYLYEEGLYYGVAGSLDRSEAACSRLVYLSVARLVHRNKPSHRE